MSAIAPSLAIRSRRGSTEARDLEEAELILQIRELQRKLARITHPDQHGSFSATRSTMDDSKHGTESPPVAAIRRLREASPGPSQRLVIVANRLPLTLSRDKTGNWTFKVSSGGLVSALTSVDDLPMVWVGWPGAVVEDDEEREKLTQSLLANNYIPVWMSQSVADRYYNGYSNTILWPLFHYIPLPMKDLYSSAEMWEAYEEANRLFAATVLKYVQRGDLTWIHDYQLMLMPGLLRAGRPRMKIGFFLHIPFPASEIYRVLPQRAEILQSLVSSDLIGFHVYDYARHFKSSCIRILGVEVNGNRVEHGTSSCIVGTYPIGIDASKFSKTIDTPEVKAHIDELETKFKGRKVIVGIDRLDYIKGIPHRLYAMECFFENNPEWIGKVVLVQIAVPSRTDVKEYQRLAKETHELVGRINGRFGSLDSLPIHYLDQSIPFHRMCALYRVADVCINTSLRDGMNLVSHEYVACQQGKSGVLILSEFTGAAQSLGAGCLRVNPWDVVEVADAIKEALCMGEAERTVYHEYSSKYVLEHSAQNWADYFVEALDRCQPPEAVEIIPPKLDFKDVCDKFNAAKGQRVIVSGLVGTLTQKRKSGVNFDMYNRFAKISPDTAKSLVKLSNMPHTSVLIITSRSQQVCEKTCSNIGAWVASENGYFMQTPESKEWTEFYGEADLAWMSEVEEVFNYFSDRTPNSVVEKEKSYISWHYRDSDPEFGEAQARELLNHLKTGPLMNSATEVVHSNRLVQVRPAGVSKGHTVEKLVQKLQAEEPVGFVLCLGNFLTKDEDMFSLLEKKLHVEQSPKTPTASEPCSSSAELVTVTLGAKASRAKNYVRSVDDVENLLAQMASRKEERMAVVSSSSGLENRPKSKFSGLRFSWVDDNVPFI